MKKLLALLAFSMCMSTVNAQTLQVRQGGTGATTASAALENVYGAVLAAQQYAGADGGAKLSAAITAACASGVKTVDARGFGAGNQTVSSTVALGCTGGSTLEVLFDQATLWVPSMNSLDMFWLMPGGIARGISIDVTGVSGYSANGVKLCCHYYLNSALASTGGTRTSLEDYNFYANGNTAGTALLLNSTCAGPDVCGAGDQNEFSDFRNLNFYGGLYGVLMTASGTGWVNGATFYNIRQSGTVHGFKMLGNGATMQGNRVFGYQSQNVPATTLDFLWITGTQANANEFYGFQNWDINAPGPGQHAVVIDSGSTGNLIEGFIGTNWPTNYVDNNADPLNVAFDTNTGNRYGWFVEQNQNINAPGFNATTITTAAGYRLNNQPVVTGDSLTTFINSMDVTGGVCLRKKGNVPGDWCDDVNGDWLNTHGNILPHTLTGYHGTGGVKVQLSDGAGTTDHPAVYASDGSLTDGPAGFTGTCAATTTLTVVKGIITGCS